MILDNVLILNLSVLRFVKSDRAVLLLNLCAALIIAYIIFLAGVDRVENQVSILLLILFKISPKQQYTLMSKLRS